jgi:hypothetical protein
MASASSQTTTGWIVFIAGLGMMAGMEAVEISRLTDWGAMMTPAFVGAGLGHFAAVVTAFVGGKLIPEARDSTTLSRSTDQKQGDEKL